ncbi:MAG TPA: ribosome-associated translation inhibitor RaiA [Nitrospiria bacterium]|nr:ribosome-associated translation inhibitor RaiA [Nitrospiria bacterium]
MQVTVTGRHMEITPALRDYAEQRLKKVARYSFKPIEAAVRLSVEKYRHTAEITLWVDGDRILAKEETDEMYRSIDRAMDKIEQRLRRYKEKLSRHKPPSAKRSSALKAPKTTPMITRDAYIVLRLSMDDAMTRLASVKAGHVVFFDDADDQLKILVRGTNGHLVLTELIIH